jgi:DNA-binding response OmpR family regulator/DNA-binding CsgD family transcriptional regulator
MKTILVVDDLPANVDIVLNHLTTQGYRVLYAGSGKRALQQLEKSLPDLILLDLRMPGIDGLETCRRIKATPDWAHLPVIFMTASDELEQKLAAFAAGAVDFVTKPILPEEVEARVRTHLRIRELQAELEAKNQKLSEEMELRLDAEKQLETNLDQGFVVANRNGQILFAARQARIALRAYFAELVEGLLPEPIRQWLRVENHDKALKLAVVQKGELQIERIAASDSGHVFLLRLTQGNNAWGPQALTALGLTPREAEVLYWITEGKTNPEISTILNTTLHTIKKHNNNLFEKLGVETRMAAARSALNVLHPQGDRAASGRPGS